MPNYKGCLRRRWPNASEIEARSKTAWQARTPSQIPRRRERSDGQVRPIAARKNGLHDVLHTRFPEYIAVRSVIRRTLSDAGAAEFHAAPP